MARDALAKTVVMSAACCAFLAARAVCQSLPAPAVRGIEVADSLLAAEFAKGDGRPHVWAHVAEWTTHVYDAAGGLALQRAP